VIGGGAQTLRCPKNLRLRAPERGRNCADSGDSSCMTANTKADDTRHVGGMHFAAAVTMSLIHVLQRTPSLAGIDLAGLTRMASFASQRSVQRGAVLWQAGDQAQALTVIRNGLIKILRVGGNGRVSLCGLFGPPESIGDVMVLKGTPYPASAVVATDTASIVSIPRELLLESLAKCPELGVSIACSVHRKLAILHDKIDILSAGAVDARLATALLKLHDEFGDELADGTSFIPVALSRRELAEFVSTAFETAIRTMSRWEHAGVLATTDHGFVLYDISVLRAVSGMAGATSDDASSARSAASEHC